MGERAGDVGGPLHLSHDALDLLPLIVGQPGAAKRLGGEGNGIEPVVQSGSRLLHVRAYEVHPCADQLGRRLEVRLRHVAVRPRDLTPWPLSIHTTPSNERQRGNTPGGRSTQHHIDRIRNAPSLALARALKDDAVDASTAVITHVH